MLGSRIRVFLEKTTQLPKGLDIRDESFADDAIQLIGLLFLAAECSRQISALKYKFDELIVLNQQRIFLFLCGLVIFKHGFGLAHVSVGIFLHHLNVRQQLRNFFVPIDVQHN